MELCAGVVVVWCSTHLDLTRMDLNAHQRVTVLFDLAFEMCAQRRRQHQAKQYKPAF